MTSLTRATPRDRLLQAAAELFYAEGITATGVEKLCRAAGVSKRSMYQLFETKDDLVADSLDRYGPELVDAYLPDPAADLTPRERIRYVFECLERHSAEPGFAGCPFVNTATELKDRAHPATLVARRYKQRLTDYFAEQAAAAGVAEPTVLAEQLTLVFDGAAARAVVRAAGLDGLSLRTVEALLAAATS